MSVIKKIQLLFEVDNKEANKEIQETATDLKQVETNMDDISETGDALTGGMVSSFKAIKASVLTAVRSLKTFKGALIATGIGAFVVAVGAVGAAFTSSESGQNEFIKITKQIGVVVGNVTDILASFGTAILNVGKYLGARFRGDAEGAAEAVDGIKESFKEATDGVKNFGEETRKELKIAAELADATARGDEIERQLIIDRAKADRDRAALLEKAVDKNKFDLQQRIGFLEEAGALEEEITNKEIALAKIRLNVIQEENKLSGSKKEDLELEAQLQADLIALETARLTKQKEVTGQIIALRTEEQAKIDADKAKAEVDKQKEIDDEAAFKLAQREALAVDEDAKTELLVTKAIERYDALIEQAKKFNGDVIGLEEAKAAAVAEITKKSEDDTAEITEEGEKFKVSTLAKFIALGVGIAAEGSNAAKALAIAQSLISTYQAAADVQKNPLSVTPFQKAADMALVLAAGFAQVRAITQTQIPVLSVGGVSAGGGSTSPAPQLQAPDFNVVGASPINQLAEAIGGQQQQPVRAYVVAEEVTSAQELERNRIRTAALGSGMIGGI